MGRDFVLVHGMSHGAWCWEPLIARLEDRGHRALAVDLPGHGRRAHERRRASVAGYATAVADAMKQHGIARAILVGHSMAGVVIPKVAELVPARVAHLVYLAAVVVPHGSSLIDTHIAPPIRALLRGLAASGGGVIQYPATMEWARWFNDIPPGDARLADAFGRLTPQPLRPWIERIDATGSERLRVPRTYIRCLDDRAVPPAVAAAYAARLGVTPVDMNTAHGPMLSAPNDLVKVLEEIR